MSQSVLLIPLIQVPIGNEKYMSLLFCYIDPELSKHHEKGRRKEDDKSEKEKEGV